MALAWNAGWVNALRGSNPLSSASCLDPASWADRGIYVVGVAGPRADLLTMCHNAAVITAVRNIRAMPAVTVRYATPVREAPPTQSTNPLIATSAPTASGTQQVAAAQRGASRGRCSGAVRLQARPRTTAMTSRPTPPPTYCAQDVPSKPKCLYRNQSTWVAAQRPDGTRQDDVGGGPEQDPHRQSPPKPAHSGQVGSQHMDVPEHPSAIRRRAPGAEESATPPTAAVHRQVGADEPQQ